MAIPEGRMSTTPVPGNYLPPDDRDHPLLEDYEQGPIALTDTSEGLAYQSWHLTYVANDFIITPETVGPPVTVHSAPNVTQCTFAFDQNANIAVSYMEAGIAKLYWFDTQINDYVVTQSATGAVSPALTLDDKRPEEVGRSDILLFYTRQNPDSTYSLYMRRQRDRYTIETLMANPVWPYIWKFGMNDGLRVQLSNGTEEPA
jgi:hypothetical protein